MTTIPAEPKKRHRLTQEDCDTARLLMARRRTLKEIADIIGVDPSTVGKIRLADYNLEKYLEQRKEMNRKTAENKARAEERRAEFLKKRWPELPPVATIVMSTEPETPAEVPGQMKMDLEPEKDPTPAAQDDSAKLMRFFAAQVDKVLKKMDELIDAIPKGGA